VVSGLVAAGQNVRAVSRRPLEGDAQKAVHVVNVDLQEPLADATLFDDVAGLFLNSSATMDQTGGFLKTAASSGVSHVVLVSSVYVEDGLPADGQRDAIAGMHRSMEELVEKSGMA